ncbi:riboflavine-aldehyde-forming enzyme [Xylariomycetidae sp. FL0641]|nr:riboflavine-aldehyde-forming enzyme [Xylariomycetidae sp. FL0641]
MARLTSLLSLLALAVTQIVAFSGDMTYYAPGLGSCGQTNTAAEDVVALNAPQVPGTCGRMINIHYMGRTASARVVDTCPGCAFGSVDVSPALFGKLADLSKGRVQVTWEFA